MDRPGAVVFDIGRVLIEWEPARFFEALLGPEESARLFAEVDLAGMNEAVDLGAPFRETVEATAARYPQWEGVIRLWHDRWIELASPAIPGSVRLLEALKARGVPVFALSNFGLEPFEIARARYPFLDLFDRRFLSGRLGLMKPDPRIYALVEAETGLPPGRLLFTDDRADNIAAAAARGWRTHLFDGPEGFARRLAAEGLLPAGEAVA